MVNNTNQNIYKKKLKSQVFIKKNDLITHHFIFQAFIKKLFL
jgi:hypothetical protein